VKVKSKQPPLALKPTQFSLGIREAERKIRKLKKLSRKQRARLVRKKPIPVVVSPWRELCVVDHHHFLFACWAVGIKKVRVKVVADFSKSRLTYEKFWRTLGKKRLAYLYDQFGQGPRLALYLPLDVRGMADDPYRSLAWMVRKRGAYRNSDETFGEFKWADFFRAHKLLDQHGRLGYERAVHLGSRLARSPEAQGLPGYIGHERGAHVTSLHRGSSTPRNPTGAPPDRAASTRIGIARRS
jgi:hypothetical protein